MLLLLRELAKACQTRTFNGFSGGEAATVLVGNWTEACAVLCQRTDMDQLEARLLQLRVRWLRHLGTHGARVWATAHVRMALWINGGCNKGTSPPKTHPQADMCISTNLLPDPKKYLLQLPLFQTSQIKSPIGVAKCKVTHLLNKCLPKRCQIRELTRFLSEYCISDYKVGLLFTRMMFCSFSGIYGHCTETPPFGIVVSLCATLIYQDANESGLIQWIRGTECCNKGGNANQLVCLHVIREYLCVCVSSQPTLRAKLCKHFNWGVFEEATFCTMQRIRVLLYRHCLHDNFDLSGVRILDKFASALHEIMPDILPESTKLGRHYLKLQHLLHIFNKLRTTQLKLLTTQGDCKLEVMCHKINTCSQGCNLTGLIDRMRALCKDSGTFKQISTIIACVHSNTAESVARNAMSKLLHTDMFCYALFEYELRDTVQQLSTRVHMLPPRMPTLHDVSHSGSSTKPMFPQFQSNLFYCASCNTVANSCIVPNKKRTLTRSHMMSVRTVVDDDNCMLLCAQNSKRSTNSLGNLRTVTFDNCLDSIQCHNRPLLVIPMHNRLVQLRNKLYSLCTSCGHIIKLEDGMQLMCRFCKAKAETVGSKGKCFMCNKKSMDPQHILCFSIRAVNLFELTELCSACLSHLCKVTREKIITKKQITAIYTRLQRKRSLTIPGDRYDFFHPKLHKH